LADESNTPSGGRDGDIRSVSITDEMRRSYVDYAMSVIVSRALPDVRDGLKPVHRRILFSMNENGYDWNKPYRKSAASSATLSASTIRTATSPSTTRWCAWRSNSPCGCR
jgi:DNA gyrase/topoisomerase IV subunit A